MGGDGARTKLGSRAGRGRDMRGLRAVVTWSVQALPRKVAAGRLFQPFSARKMMVSQQFQRKNGVLEHADS
jgi:hypothetical protein